MTSTNLELNYSFEAFDVDRSPVRETDVSFLESVFFLCIPIKDQGRTHSQRSRKTDILKG